MGGLYGNYNRAGMDLHSGMPDSFASIDTQSATGIIANRLTTPRRIGQVLFCACTIHMFI
jgi:hypothetical protein